MNLLENGELDYKFFLLALLLLSYAVCAQNDHSVLKYFIFRSHSRRHCCPTWDHAGLSLLCIVGVLLAIPIPRPVAVPGITGGVGVRIARVLESGEREGYKLCN